MSFMRVLLVPIKKKIGRTNGRIFGLYMTPVGIKSPVPKSARGSADVKYLCVCVCVCVW